ncbi:Nn.00g019120.m01.CDS01 [Neocucurbitaria sp. VM-36]
MAPLAANAHMIMADPKPFGSPNNSPLDPSGSDFPCKAVPYTVNTMNDWPVGSTQSLAFTGSAVHGGGSCQISVTTDKEPTKDSKWKVIYSIEGGCPAAVGGNLGEKDNADGTFPFTVPPELPNGEMAMAWTWFNKVGNREMYMNCAPIKVSGASDDKAAFEALPNMAVANIGTSTCKTTEANDYTFEKPGKYKTTAGQGPFVSLCGGAPATGGDAPGPQQPAAPQPSPASPGIPSAAPVPSRSPVQISTLRTIITVTAPLGPAPTTSQGGVFASSAKSPTAPQPSQAPPAPAPGSGTANGDPCSPDGSVVCNGDTQFGICNHGSVVWQDVAAGTKCKDGAIAKRDYSHRNMRTAI